MMLIVLFLFLMPTHLVESYGPQVQVSEYSNHPYLDDELVRQIYLALSEDTTISIHTKNLNVHVQGGFVTIDGFVDSGITKDNITAKIKTIEGVKKVQNNLIVR